MDSSLIVTISFFDSSNYSGVKKKGRPKGLIELMQNQNLMVDLPGCATFRSPGPWWPGSLSGFRIHSYASA